MAAIQDGINGIGEGFKNVFLAGIGALAITGEKGKELVDTLVAKGEMTIDQGKQINQELQHKASNASKTVREATLEARMSVMTPEEREEFAAKAAEIAAQQNAAAEANAVEAEVVEEPCAAEADAAEEACAGAPAAAEPTAAEVSDAEAAPAE